MKKLLTVLLLLNFTVSLLGQDKEIIKLWKSNSARKGEIEKNQSKISTFQISIDSLTESNKKLTTALNLLKEKDKIRNNQLDKSLTIYGNSTSGIGNKLDTLSIVIGITALLLTLAGLGLGFYIKKKEEDIKVLLKQSDKNLKDQNENQSAIEKKLQESKEETEKLRNSVNENLSQLYQKLKDEELKEMIETLNSSPMQITNHVSRLITLNVPEENFELFKSMMFSWEKDPNHATNIDYLLMFLINRFPIRMAANQQVSPIIMRFWKQTGRAINFDKLEEFVDEYVKEFFNNKYQAIEKELGEIFNGLGNWYNFRYIATKMLFEKYTSKEHRFKLLKMMLDEKVHEVSIQYKQDMLNTYLGAANTEEQNNLLEIAKGKPKEEIAKTNGTNKK